MGKIAKVVGGIFVLAIIGQFLDDTPSLNNRLAEAIISGQATAEQWADYNKALNEKARLCVISAANEKAKAGAWNPDALSIDYTSAYAAGDYVTENNRDPNPSFTGSVAMSGTNAFGATIKSRVDGFGVMKLEKDGSKYEIRCRY